ncbi:MAG: cupin domain-containing protein [Gammaproteobacteria bacterium]|nr:cupin domain-containing protein [Gammaproteobacteria bacterium]
MPDQTVIKYDPQGHPETGLQTWDPIPQDIITSGNPVQRGHQYYGTEEDRVISGVWDCTAFEQKRFPYDVDEFMLVLGGSISIEDESGHTETFRAGESFILPKYTDCAWKQSELALKFYFIHDNPASSAPDNAGDLAAIRVDHSAELPRVTDLDASQFMSAMPDMGMNILYSDPTEKLTIGLWDCSPMKRVPGTLARSELMHILEGSGSITNADGVVFNFKAGDTFLVPIGMGYQWQNDEYVKKVFCSYTP